MNENNSVHKVILKMDIDMDVYLKSKMDSTVPEKIFLHVETSYDNGFKKGMLLYVRHKISPDVYWIAEVTLACGPAIWTKFIGDDKEFCCNMSTTEVLPLDWFGKYDVQPPDYIFEKDGNKIYGMVSDAIATGTAVPMNALNNKGLPPIDRINIGMKVKVQNIIDPFLYQTATISENIGGRLRLRYNYADDTMAHFWMFFNDPRLLGLDCIKNKPNRILEVHRFVTGMKLEALDPYDMKSVRPATVVKVFNNIHFLVVIDDHEDDYEETKMAWLCDSMHPYIYPIGWAQKNDVVFKTPNIWKEESFNWDQYLSLTSSVPAPEHFFCKKEQFMGIEKGMNLEAVNPLNPDEIHLASINSIIEHMLCVELLPIGEKFYYAQNSDLLFPVGWTYNNNYDLHVAEKTILKKPVDETVEILKEDATHNIDKSCQGIYINYNCYSGPTISRKEFCRLPKYVGPGPITLVLKEVLNKILFACRTPSKLVKDWQADGTIESGRKPLILKVKSKRKSQYVPVITATAPEDVTAFCKEACRKMRACPNLFGPIQYIEQCPANCPRHKNEPYPPIVTKKPGSKPNVEAKSKTKQQQTLETNEDRESVINSQENGKLQERTMHNRTRGVKLINFAVQMKKAYWDKKEIYSGMSNQESQCKLRTPAKRKKRTVKKKKAESEKEKAESEKEKAESEKENNPLPETEKKWLSSDSEPEFHGW